MKKYITAAFLLFMFIFISCQNDKFDNQPDNSFDEIKDKALADKVDNAIKPAEYVKLLGKGLDVDWAKTTQGITYYNLQSVKDFKQKGLSHVRIRIKDDASETLLLHLDNIVNDCLAEGLIPVIAYQGNEFKTEVTPENMAKVVSWWKTVSERYKNISSLVSYNILIEVSDALNKEPNKLNALYEEVVTEIRKTNPKRIIFISPRKLSDPEYLSELRIPTQHNGYLMAEWHFYAAGPSKTNPKKLWTTGTEEEKNIIRTKIKTAMDWQKSTGILTWVGAWMAGNYNDGDDYTVEEQIVFATFVSCELDKAQIPFAVNSDTKFYNRETNKWETPMVPLLSAILNPNCN